jgi:ATP-dependent Clp protease adaptor protein ClpS
VARDVELRAPQRYRVLFHDDDTTTMEFVVDVLMRLFHKSPAAATQIMLEVHHKGIGVAGVFSRQVAESKVAQVQEEAGRQGMPLRVTMEPLA